MALSLIDKVAFFKKKKPLNAALGRERFVNIVRLPASLLPCQNAPPVPSFNARIPDNNIPFSVVSSHCVCRIPLVSAPAGTHARRDTPPRFRARAHPPLIRVYTHPTPVAAEIILRHTAFFLELIGAVRFRGPGKAPGTKNESVPTLPLTQQDPHSWLHSAKTATFPSPPFTLRLSPPLRTRIFPVRTQSLLRGKRRGPGSEK